VLAAPFICTARVGLVGTFFPVQLRLSAPGLFPWVYFFRSDVVTSFCPGLHHFLIAYVERSGTFPRKDPTHDNRILLALTLKQTTIGSYLHFKKYPKVSKSILTNKDPTHRKPTTPQILLLARVSHTCSHGCRPALLLALVVQPEASCPGRAQIGMSSSPDSGAGVVHRATVLCSKLISRVNRTLLALVALMTGPAAAPRTPPIVSSRTTLKVLLELTAALKLTAAHVDHLAAICAEKVQAAEEAAAEEWAAEEAAAEESTTAQPTVDAYVPQRMNRTSKNHAGILELVETLIKKKVFVKGKQNLIGTAGFNWGQASKWTLQHQAVIKDLLKAISKDTPADFTFNAISVNVNVDARSLAKKGKTLHVHPHNTDKSLIMTIGKFTGGELGVAHDQHGTGLVKLNPYQKWISFDGKNEWHGNQPHKGERISIILYSVKCHYDIEILTELGFRIKAPDNKATFLAGAKRKVEDSERPSERPNTRSSEQTPRKRKKRNYFVPDQKPNSVDPVLHAVGRFKKVPVRERYHYFNNVMRLRRLGAG